MKFLPSKGLQLLHDYVFHTHIYY